MILQPDHAAEPATAGAADRLGRLIALKSMSACHPGFNNARAGAAADGSPSGLALLE
jgi:hypothetical protein